MEFATPPTLTGNPGQPRDLQFNGPLLEMFHRGAGQGSQRFFSQNASMALYRSISAGVSTNPCLRIGNSSTW